MYIKESLKTMGMQKNAENAKECEKSLSYHS